MLRFVISGIRNLELSLKLCRSGMLRLLYQHLTVEAPSGGNRGHLYVDTCAGIRISNEFKKFECSQAAHYVRGFIVKKNDFLLLTSQIPARRRMS